MAHSSTAVPGGDTRALRDHLLICGWNRAVPRIIDGLAETVSATGQAIVLVNQKDPTEMAELRARYPTLDLRHVRGQHHLDATLREAGCAAAAAAIVVADDSVPDPDNRTIICTLAIANISRETKTCAELLNRENEPNLKRAGVHEVVVRGENGGFFLSAGALAPGLSKAARKLITFGSGSELHRAPIPRALLGRTFGELQEHLRREGALAIGIIREAQLLTVAEIFGSSSDWIDAFIKESFAAVGEDVLDRERDPIKVHLNPPDDFVLELKDYAIVIGGAAQHG